MADSNSKLVKNGRGAGWKNADWKEATDPNFRGVIELDEALPAGKYWVSFWVVAGDPGVAESGKPKPKITFSVGAPQAPQTASPDEAFDD